MADDSIGGRRLHWKGEFYTYGHLGGPDGAAPERVAYHHRIRCYSDGSWDVTVTHQGETGPPSYFEGAGDAFGLLSADAATAIVILPRHGAAPPPPDPASPTPTP